MSILGFIGKNRLGFGSDQQNQPENPDETVIKAKSQAHLYGFQGIDP